MEDDAARKYKPRGPRRNLTTADEAPPTITMGKRKVPPDGKRKVPPAKRTKTPPQA